MDTSSMSTDPLDLLEPPELREERESADPRAVLDLSFPDPRDPMETKERRDAAEERENPESLDLLEARDKPETASTALHLVLLPVIKPFQLLWTKEIIYLVCNKVLFSTDSIGGIKESLTKNGVFCSQWRHPRYISGDCPLILP